MKELNYIEIAERLKNRRLQMNYSYQELADKVGMSKSTLQRYETGTIKNIPIARLKSLSAALDMDPNELIGIKGEGRTFPAKNLLPPPETYQVPRLGQIACGAPILAEQNIETYDSVPVAIRCDFTLLCKGDSMIGAGIEDGDFNNGSAILLLHHFNGLFHDLLGDVLRVVHQNFHAILSFLLMVLFYQKN